MHKRRKQHPGSDDAAGDPVRIPDHNLDDLAATVSALVAQGQQRATTPLTLPMSVDPGKAEPRSGTVFRPSSAKFSSIIRPGTVFSPPEGVALEHHPRGALGRTAPAGGSLGSCCRIKDGVRVCWVTTKLRPWVGKVPSIHIRSPSGDRAEHRR